MEKGKLITKDQLKKDLEALGVKKGMTVMVHSSLKSVGRVIGGPVSVIMALEEAVGAGGNIVMPTQTEQLCDPSEYEGDLSEEEMRVIRDHLPVYHPDLTPTCYMGFIPETFRKQDGVFRSAHPHTSFAAWGKDAAYITENHGMDFALGEKSPLGKVYELDGRILLLGAPADSNSSLHLAEYRQENSFVKEKIWDVKVKQGEEEVWTTYRDINNDSDDFDRIFEDYRRDTSGVMEGKVGEAKSYLMPMREMVEYTVGWMNGNRE